jgi:hypothetical protein
MTGILRTIVAVAWPHGGQRGSRANAAAALAEVRAVVSERASVDR